MKHFFLSVTLFLFAVTATAQQNSNSATGIKEASPAITKQSASIHYDSEATPLSKPAAAFINKNWRPQGDTDPDKWSFEVSPYAWTAALKGDLRVRNTTARVDASFSDIFHNLDFTLETAVKPSKAGGEC